MLYDDPYFTYDFQHIDSGKENYQLSWSCTSGRIYNQTIFISENGIITSVTAEPHVRQIKYSFPFGTLVEWQVRVNFTNGISLDSTKLSFTASHS